MKQYHVEATVPIYLIVEVTVKAEDEDQAILRAEEWAGDVMAMQDLEVGLYKTHPDGMTLVVTDADVEGAEVFGVTELN